VTERRPKTHSSKVTIRETMPASSLDVHLLREMDQALREQQQAAIDHLAGELYWPTPQVRPNRLRRWLGWKLWRLAAWLNPEVME
jgi:hypothetical protein